MWYGIVGRFVGPPISRFEQIIDIRFFDHKPTEEEVKRTCCVNSFMEAYQDGVTLEEALEDYGTTVEQLMHEDYIDEKNVVVLIDEVPNEKSKQFFLGLY